MDGGGGVEKRGEEAGRKRETGRNARLVIRREGEGKGQKEEEK